MGNIENEAKKELQKELNQLGLALKSVEEMVLPLEFHQKIVNLFKKELLDIENFAKENNLL